MPSVPDYLDLTFDDAVAQWSQISARQPRKRQEKFVPVEVILCHGLFYLLNPHRYGGRNIHTVPDEAKLLADLFVRPATSLTNKMLNLDGSRANAGRCEPEVFLRLRDTPGLFVALYSRVLEAARSVGIDSHRLPDFLGVAEGLVLLGQDEIGDTELATLLEEERESILALMSQLHMDERGTTRLVEHRARLGQHRFARQVLQNYEHQCAFCGFAPRSLPRQGLLVASHIKPWRASTNRERLDPANGVAACPVHDNAFDRGLLTVNGGYRIHRSDPLALHLAADSGAEHYFGESVLREHLILPSAGKPGSKYLAYHKAEIFQQAS